MRATGVCEVVDSGESTTTLGCQCCLVFGFSVLQIFFYPRWICGLIRPPTSTSTEYLSPHFIIFMQSTSIQCYQKMYALLLIMYATLFRAMSVFCYWRHKLLKIHYSQAVLQVVRDSDRLAYFVTKWKLVFLYYLFALECLIID